MGMDVIGRNPRDGVGNYFRNNVWRWHPLAEYGCEVAPEIAAKCRHWHSNDGDGLDAEDSIRLADLLQKETDAGRTLDPYGIRGELPEECRQVGREYFARAAGSDIWVDFIDLPEETAKALWEMHRHKLAFPAGLSLNAAE